MGLLNAFAIVCAVVGVGTALILVARGVRYGWLLALGPSVLLVLNLAIVFGWYRP